MAEIRKLEDGWFSCSPIDVATKLQTLQDNISALQSQRQTIDDRIADLQSQVNYINSNNS